MYLYLVTLRKQLYSYIDSAEAKSQKVVARSALATQR